MNKYQKALDKLDNQYKNDNILQELVDKETPMKIIYEFHDNISIVKKRTCPKCENELPHDMKYCNLCGQRLELS